MQQAQEIPKRVRASASVTLCGAASANLNGESAKAMVMALARTMCR